MLDDDFQKIEDFLKSQDEPKTNFLQKFDKEVSKLLEENFNFSGDKGKENFLIVYKALGEAHRDFMEAMVKVMKNYSIYLILTKNILEGFNETKGETVLAAEDESIYKVLMKLLIDSLEKECNMNIEDFTVFLEYFKEVILPLSNIKS